MIEQVFCWIRKSGSRSSLDQFPNNDFSILQSEVQFKDQGQISVFFPSWEFDLFRSEHQHKYTLGMYCFHLYVSYSILTPSFSLEEDSLCPLPASKNPTLPCTREGIYCWDCYHIFAIYSSCILGMTDAAHTFQALTATVSSPKKGCLGLKPAVLSKMIEPMDAYLLQYVRYLQMPISLCIEKSILPVYWWEKN